jgi:hypothetical protein
VGIEEPVQVPSDDAAGAAAAGADELADALGVAVPPTVADELAEPVALGVVTVVAAVL